MKTTLDSLFSKSLFIRYKEHHIKTSRRIPQITTSPHLFASRRAARQPQSCFCNMPSTSLIHVQSRYP
ncbi:hypothetical protein BGW80DRAFT_1277036 [Lactifluus volemus]|nr:hypothetical protein BGW80DRAFT_1277036 [Lactifluus volemus]